MFQTLPASRRTARRFSPASLIAVVAHLALAAAAASATSAAPHGRSVETIEHPLPLLVRKHEAPGTAPTAGPTRLAAAPTLSDVPDLPSLMPAAATIPSIAPAASLDLRALTGLHTPIGLIGGERDGPEGRDVALAGDQVDDPVLVIAQRPPRYPPALEAAGITGAVHLSFVVDTTGHVEPASLHVIEMTAPGFEASARDALLATRFRPARARGQTVRQLAEQWVRFTVNH